MDINFGSENLENINVLVVDDESIFCMILKKRLEALGYNTMTTISAMGALEILDDTLPEMIITDLMMPEMDGLELCRRLKRKKQLKNTYILMLSARSDKESINDSYKAGAHEFVTKPIDDDELSDKIQTGIEWSRERMEKANRGTRKFEIKK